MYNVCTRARNITLASKQFVQSESHANQKKNNYPALRDTPPSFFRAKRGENFFGGPYYFLRRRLLHTRRTGLRPARRAEVGLLFLVQEAGSGGGRGGEEERRDKT